MLKRILSDTCYDTLPCVSDCLDLEHIAVVEISSENSEYPIEAALPADQSQGWRAGEPGKQTIRLLFEHPQPIRSIQLMFSEPSIVRTQEYIVRTSSDNGHSFLEIVRQQWNFHPHGGEMELEQHIINLPAVNIIEITINPDINNASIYASLEKLRLF